ncbi:MAG: F0F1 ATP synthase subunit B [Actinobacteria bacterium]|uniref:Unannotated protein n=1 Tax=freshwater metagenome TaxID=449393 RepID=A0A6J5ZYN9_9ZZZZ|nr:F0F1 ATP synthase subunit B [Actinomycetota bacterium]
MIAALTPIASAAAEEGSSTFLVSPNVGLMIWTLLAFGVTLIVLNKFAFPAIRDALDKRVKMIEDSIADAEKAREESDALLAEYRERLKDARVQADEIVMRARKNAETFEADSTEEARAKRAEMLDQTRRDIEAETRRAIEEIRSEVADLTVLATEKVTGRVLTDADQQRLVDEALADLDFSAISGERRN